MKYLKIANVGEMEKEALTLFGGTTKRGDSTKIGMFGSGNKYAIAFFLRNGFEIKIFSGKNEIKVGTIEKSFRGNNYDVITIDGMETSITTESGPQWEFWHAIREIYSNALDEGIIEMNETVEPLPFENETHFYLKWNEDVEDFFTNIQKYFSKNRTVFYSNLNGKCFATTKQSNLIVYRKGIRCYVGEDLCLYHYDFDQITINESRTIESRSEMVEMIHNFIFSTTDNDIIDNFYSTSHNTSFIEQSSPGIFRNPNYSLLCERWIQRIPKKYLATKTHTVLMSEKELEDCHIVQYWFFELMKKRFGDEIVPPFFREKKTGINHEYREIVKTDKVKAYLDIAFDFFKEVGYNFERNVKIVKFSNNKTIGAHKGDILLSQEVFQQGRSHLIMQLIYLDMQIEASEKEIPKATHMASKFISYMAEKHAYLF